MPVIQLLGLPGSGKSTLARQLQELLSWPRSFRIGTYHKRFPWTETGDAAAWQAMLRDMEERNWNNFIFESSGINPRWNTVLDHCQRDSVLTIKLECKLPELLQRISTKTPEDQAHGDWFPPDRFREKTEFVQAIYRQFMSFRGDVILDTTWASPAEIFDLTKQMLAVNPKFVEAAEA